MVIPSRRRGYLHRNAPLLPASAATSTAHAKAAGLSPRQQRRAAFWDVNKDIIRHQERLEKAQKEREEGVWLGRGRLVSGAIVGQCINQCCSAWGGIQGSGWGPLHAGAADCRAK